jgi:hypothetical protein
VSTHTRPLLVRALDVPAVDALDHAECARQAADNLVCLPVDQQRIAEYLVDALSRLAAAAAVGGLVRYASTFDGFAIWIREDFLL